MKNNPENKKYVINVDLPNMQITVNALSYIEAVKKACDVIQKIESLDGVSFDDYIDIN